MPYKNKADRNQWIRDQYFIRKQWLMHEMSMPLPPKCHYCGRIAKLEFHHPNGRDWEPMSKDRLTRLKLYRKDFLAGELVLACIHCNKSHRFDNKPTEVTK